MVKEWAMCGMGNGWVPAPIQSPSSVSSRARTDRLLIGNRRPALERGAGEPSSRQLRPPAAAAATDRLPPEAPYPTISAVTRRAKAAGSGSGLPSASSDCP